MLENFASLPMCTVMPASPFIPDSLFSNSCAQSTDVVWSQGKATKLWCTCFSFTSMTFITIYWLQLCNNVSSKLLKNFSKPIFFGNFQLPLGNLNFDFGFSSASFLGALECWKDEKCCWSKTETQLPKKCKISFLPCFSGCFRILSAISL